MRLRSRAAVTVTVVGAVMAFAAQASPAPQTRALTPLRSAANATVTIYIGSWWCESGGSPKISWGYVNGGGSWNTQPGNSVTTWAPMNRQVSIYARVFCKKFIGGYYRDVWANRWFSFSPTSTWI